MPFFQPFYVTRAPYRLLRLSGRDRVALLHNMTTADIRSLAEGQSCEATLVDQKGLLLDWVTIHALPDAHVVVTHAPQAEAVLAWLDRYVITEDVTLALEPVETPLWLLVGDAWEAATQGLTHVATAPPWQAPGFAPMGCLIALSTESLEIARNILDSQGWQEQSPQYLDSNRVAWGIPGPAHEFAIRTNPWELRLGRAIADNKGCYLGQEVVARLKNYDKVQRHLMGLEVIQGGPPEINAGLWAPDDVERQRVIGRVTSVVTDPSVPGGCGVLALVKRAYAHADQSLTLGSAEGPCGLVRVVDRWFWIAEEKPEIK